MRTEVITPPPDDQSEHVICWSEVTGAHSQQVAGEVRAAALWNALHEATVDPARRVNGMVWVEVVQLRDEDGNDQGTREVLRANFTHQFGALGVYADSAAAE